MPTTIEQGYATLSSEEAADLKTALEVLVTAAADVRDRLAKAFPTTDNFKSLEDIIDENHDISQLWSWFRSRPDVQSLNLYAYIMWDATLFIEKAVKADMERITAAADGREFNG
jgi:hypothetical protein